MEKMLPPATLKSLRMLWFILGGFARTVPVDKLPFCKRRGLVIFIWFDNAPRVAFCTQAIGAAVRCCNV